MLTILAGAWRQISEDVMARLPEEACGILLGRGDTVMEAWVCRNAHPGDRTRNFELAPQDQFDCARHARAAGLELVAYYHSHPNGSPEFSETDKRLAVCGSRHVIIPVAGGQLGPPRSYRIRGAVSTG
ncbi:MAG: M67 family metallopeptidase [Bryobacteraceae bacterium]|nr:M67 family metallopeptidase [Bryobacteraceae bacterium]